MTKKLLEEKKLTIEERKAKANVAKKIYLISGIILCFIGFAGAVPALIMMSKIDGGETVTYKTWLPWAILGGSLVVVFIGSWLLSLIEKTNKKIKFAENDELLSQAGGDHEYYYVRCVSNRFDALFLDKTTHTFGIRTGKEIKFEKPTSDYLDYKIFENDEDRTNSILYAHPITIGDNSYGVSVDLIIKDMDAYKIVYTSDNELIPMNHSAYQALLTELRDLVAMCEAIRADGTPEVKEEQVVEAPLEAKTE